MKNGRDGGGSGREDISLTYFPSFHFLFLSFSCFFSLFFQDNLKFQKNLHEIRMWRSFWF